MPGGKTGVVSVSPQTTSSNATTAIDKDKTTTSLTAALEPKKNETVALKVGFHYSNQEVFGLKTNLASITNESRVPRKLRNIPSRLDTSSQQEQRELQPGDLAGI